ncbi:twin-arginine translocase subunit TatB [Parasphingopyxis sp. CP4]|uniref:Sec-independent protein translocase protein TatB n=1 Tax=Parasphingopyxis sp. CP4 TaxID=2724527 RepID=UPI0015A033B8|nr:Sec-independent protein translocase protein TatB [Parasphingopyxis sp. CP4]QLC20717.1 twin-arginine translocase subunit TatB [Parasphingopyxis sp. CP4]
MFDIGAIELLLVAAVALVIIGPKDLPIAMRTAGRWLGQLRAMTGHFRIGIDAMIREAEVEENEKAWAEKNEQVMRDHPREKYQDADPDDGPDMTADEAVMKAKKEAAAQQSGTEPQEDVADTGTTESVAEGPVAEASNEPQDEPTPAETQLPLLPEGPDDAEQGSKA